MPKGLLAVPSGSGGSGGCSACGSGPSSSMAISAYRLASAREPPAGPRGGKREGGELLPASCPVGSPSRASSAARRRSRRSCRTISSCARSMACCSGECAASGCAMGDGAVVVGEAQRPAGKPPPPPPKPPLTPMPTPTPTPAASLSSCWESRSPSAWVTSVVAPEAISALSCWDGDRGGERCGALSRGGRLRCGSPSLRLTSSSPPPRPRGWWRRPEADDRL